MKPAGLDGSHSVVLASFGHGNPQAERTRKLSALLTSWRLKGIQAKFDMIRDPYIRNPTDDDLFGLPNLNPKP